MLLVFSSIDCIYSYIQLLAASVLNKFTVSVICTTISAVLRQLHIPVKYKIAMLVHQSLWSHPSELYLTDDCRLATDTGVRRLCSVDTQTGALKMTDMKLQDIKYTGWAKKVSLYAVYT